MIDIDTITRLALESAGGLNSLREVVLSLAMHGKLVDQDPFDESASILLQRLKEKNSYDGMPDKKSAKQLPDFTPLKESDHPYQLPSGWVWVKLSSVGEINPRNKTEDDSQVGFIPMSLIQDGYANKHSFQIKKWSEVKQGFTHFQEGDIGVAKITPCFENRKSCVFRNLPNGKGAGTTELHIYRDTYNVFDPEYLLLYFKTESFISIGKSNMTGTAGQQRIPKNYFTETPIPLPPLAEQKRITEKIKYLMHQCEELDEKCVVRSENLRLAHSASIKRFLSADNADEFASSWEFISKHFEIFYSAKENVEELKKAILTLAMKGKLVDQDPNDEPTTKIIISTRQELSFHRSDPSRRAVSDNTVTRNHDLYEIPASWVWTTVGEISRHNSGKTLDKARNSGEMRDYITTSNLYWGRFELSQLRQMPIQDKELERCTALKGDLLICEGGEAGRAAVWEKDFGVCFQNHIHRVRLLGGIDPYFVYLYFRKLAYTGEIDSYRKGVGISNMSSKSLASIPVPLPPINEQKRIVKSVEQYLMICDELIEKLDEAVLKQSQVLESIVRQVTAS